MFFFHAAGAAQAKSATPEEGVFKLMQIPTWHRYILFFFFLFFINKSEGLKSACPTDSTTSTNEQQGETERQRLAATKASKMPEWEEMMFFGRGTCLRLCERQDHDIHAYMLPYRMVILHRRPSSSLAPERRRERPVPVLTRILLPVLFALRGCRNTVVIV